MPKRRYLELTAEERSELEAIRDHHAKPYVREKAAGLLKIADGLSAHAVALSGLLRRRDPDSVYGWLDEYEAAGVEGLEIKAGRGRKPAFSPSLPSGRGG